MKKRQKTHSQATEKRSLFPIEQTRSRKKKINRTLRLSLLTFFLVLSLIFVLAFLIAWQPWDFQLQKRMLHARASGTVAYDVELKDEIAAEPGSDRYLSELVVAVEPSWHLHFRADREMTGSARSTLSAIIQAHEPGEGQPVLLETTTQLLDPWEDEITGLADYVSARTMRVNLADYRKQANEIAARLDHELDFELKLELKTNLLLDLPDGIRTISESAFMTIPLNSPVLQITTSVPDAQEDKILSQTIHYRIYFDTIPYPFFLVAASISLAIYLLLIITTSHRAKDRFYRRYNRMLGRLKGRSIQIANKAWDPDWCISIADFNSLALTAQKLKLPVYVYLDSFSAWPVAYFYLLSAENNYCYIFSEHPELFQQEQNNLNEQTTSPLPVLPEADELPDPAAGSEIHPIRPYES